jgi:hypothetical protein
MTRTAEQILTEARALIAERGWCQHDYARSVDGVSLGTRDARAAAFCMEGAVMGACIDWADVPLALRFLERACPSIVSDKAPVVAFNDAPARTREEVLAAFDRAIELAKASSR